jgi:hypothetical protein
MEMTNEETQKAIFRNNLRQLLLNALAKGMSISQGNETSVKALGELTDELDKLLEAK